MSDGLVLGGGGSLGAFSVGVLRWLAVDKGLHFDVVTGTSTGALSAVLAASGEVGLLSDLYTNVETRDILYAGLLGDANMVLHGYVNSVDPLRALIERYLTPARLARIVSRGVKLRIAITSLQRGLVEYGTETDPLPELREKILASACQPVLMPTIPIGGYDYLDGGVMQMLPIQAALDAGATRIYACATSAAPADRAPITRRFPNRHGTDVLNYTLRRAVLLLATQQTDDTLDLMAARGVDMRVFRPAGNLAPSPLEFSPSEMAAMVDEGYLRAQALLP